MERCRPGQLGRWSVDWLGKDDVLLADDSSYLSVYPLNDDFSWAVDVENNGFRFQKRSA